MSIMHIRLRGCVYVPQVGFKLFLCIVRLPLAFGSSLKTINSSPVLVTRQSSLANIPSNEHLPIPYFSVAEKKTKRAGAGDLQTCKLASTELEPRDTG